MRVSVDELRELGRGLLRQYGYSEDEAGTILAVMMYSQLRGGNQGLVKLIGRGIPKPVDAGEIVKANETAISEVVDGARNHAMVVVSHAVDRALQKVLSQGIAIVGVRGISTSSGAVGYYAHRISRSGCIGLVFASAMPAVAPEGSYEPIFGANPLAMAFPTEAEPIVLDLATSAMAVYGLVEAAIAHRSIAPDVAFDANGESTTDPNEGLRGALRTFDRGPKSSALALAVEVLAGPLVGAAFAGTGDPSNTCGHLIIALDPGLLGATEFSRAMTELATRVREAKPLPGITAVRLPGDRGDSTLQRALQSGELEIDAALYSELQVKSRDVG